MQRISPQTVHIGHFIAALKPVLTINSGDIVIIETVSGPDPKELSLPCRLLSPGLPGISGSMCCHCASVSSRRIKIAPLVAILNHTRVLEGIPLMSTGPRVLQ
jgi:hypothetical protein